jgi:hypothetical protein
MIYLIYNNLKKIIKLAKKYELNKIIKFIYNIILNVDL